MPAEVLAQETVYQGRAFTVRRDTVRHQDGKKASLDIVEHPGAVAILPLDGNGNILFVRQYRHPTGKEMLELPAGTLNPGEEPLACASREIREETGFAAHKLVKLGEFFIAPGYSTEYMYLYLATDLQHDPLPGDDDEFITQETVPVEQAYEMAMRGGIEDAKSLAALLLARPLILK